MRHEQQWGPIIGFVQIERYLLKMAISGIVGFQSNKPPCALLSAETNKTS